MKRIAFILSCIIFIQSLTVAGIATPVVSSVDRVQACSISKNTITRQPKVHSCCAKKSGEKEQDKDNEKGCCGDDCKCIIHAKVFFSSYSLVEEKCISATPDSDNNIFPVFVHSYDFHAKLIYPPQA